VLHATIRRVRAAPTLLCLLLSASAFAAGHRQRAQAAESTGHAAQAAREYEEAYQEEGAPELLYRLGLVRRRLKQYELSKEAFRGYLRAAPEGELREEVTRQLAELNVLIEEQHRKVPDEEHATVRRRKAAGTARRVAGAGAGATASSTATATATPTPTPTATPTATSTSTSTSTPTSTSTSTTTATTTATPTATATTTATTIATPTTTATTTVTPALPTAAPAAAVGGKVHGTQEGTHAPRSRRARAAPWIAAGAGALAVGGAALWWDGQRISDDLHARFAAGELDAADGPRYARARRESIAGRALVAGAAALGAIAVALWW